ncbi:MAG: selenocysteine-specific translation elongation factor [Candidatus Zixiibacteriota bacterium]
MIVIGTAGHIDHGKSSIVKRLTGTDPDRLPEEKARGMTIDLGFAFYATPSGDEIAFVDVPGHERFVRNMISGAGGIDAVILVVAADDGWMPQSEEHFDILKLLGVRAGFIVLNKIDLVESDWLELLEQELRSRTANSFLAGAPIVRVSAVTGEGFDQLRDHIRTLAGTIETRRDYGKARLGIDRAFIQHGIGGVATGTLRGGSLKVGQQISLWPALHIAKIRTLQTAGKDVEQAGAGSRTAVSLTGVDKEQLVRGGVISENLNLSYFADHPVLALHAEMLKSAAVPLEDRRRVLLLAGTSEAEGEVRMFDIEALAPGESGLIFFKPDQPIYCLVGDRVILRLPTPAITLGGGMVLDHLEKFPRRRELADLEYLKTRLPGTLDSFVQSELEKRPLTRTDRLLENGDFPSEQISEIRRSLISQGAAGEFAAWTFSTSNLKASSERLIERLTAILLDKSHVKGLPLETLVTNSPFDKSSTEALVEYLVSTGQLVRTGDSYNLAGRGMTLKGVVKEAHDKIMSGLTIDRYAPPSLATFAGQGKPYQEAIKYIVDAREAHKCGAELLLLQEVWSEVIGYMKERLTDVGALAVSDLKDRFGFSRKYAIPILEETDRLKFTRRDGDIRRKGERFEDPQFTL